MNEENFRWENPSDEEITKFDKEIERAEKELYYTLLTDEEGEKGWFSAKLIYLMLKADPSNFSKLAKGFPAMAHVVRKYKLDVNGEYLKELLSKYP